MKQALEGLATVVGIGLLGFIGFSLISNQIYQYPAAVTPTATKPAATPTTSTKSTGPGSSTKPTSTGASTGVVDSNGIKWLYADGDITVVKKSRTQANDHRWSGNVSGLGKMGMEATMILDFTSAKMSGDAHFAMKHGGPNHSGSGASGGKWYDTGIRQNGAIQVQTEHPHPKNHNFACSDVGGCSVSNIGKPMNGNIIGLKWVLQPTSSGNFIALYCDNAALVGGKPANNWKKIFSIVDTKLLPGWKPPDTQDCEVRNSDTSGQKEYAGGLHVRKLTKPISQGSASYARAYYSRRLPPPTPNYYNSRYPYAPKNIDENLVMAQNPYLFQRFNSGRRL